MLCSSPPSPRRRRRWTQLALVAGLIFGTLAALPALASAALPPQGLYEECPPSAQQTCAAELAQMGSAGFRLALNYTAWAGSAAQIQAYASEAQAQGIKLIWPLNYTAWRDPGSAGSLPSEYSSLAPDCGCTTNAAFLQYVISLTRSLPATWGYYIGDELDPSQGAAVATLATNVRGLDPVHPLLYVGAGGVDTLGNLRPFAPTANVIGADIYPIGEGVSAGYVGGVASDVGRTANTAHAQPAMVLQAFSWTQYPTEIQAIAPRWPTEPEMRVMRDQALLAKPSMILWYSLKDILASDDPAGHWRDLTSAAFAPSPALRKHLDRDLRLRARAASRRRHSGRRHSGRRHSGRRHSGRRHSRSQAPRQLAR